MRVTKGGGRKRSYSICHRAISRRLIIEKERSAPLEGMNVVIEDALKCVKKRRASTDLIVSEHSVSVYASMGFVIANADVSA